MTEKQVSRLRVVTAVSAALYLALILTAWSLVESFVWLACGVAVAAVVPGLALYGTLVRWEVVRDGG